MGGRGSNKQRKSSGSSFLCFSLFRTKKQRYYDKEGYEDEIKAQKVWPSDEDGGLLGVAEPGIDMKVQAFLDAETKKRTSQPQ